MSTITSQVLPMYKASGSTWSYATSRWPIGIPKQSLSIDTFTPPAGSGFSGGILSGVNHNPVIDGDVMWLTVMTGASGATTTVDRTSTVALPQYLVRIDLSKVTAAGVAGTNTGPFGTASLNAFVTRVFETYFGATPTSTQLTTYANRIKGTAGDPLPPANMAYQFWCAWSAATVNSACGSTPPVDDGRDGRARWVTRLYEAAFDRWPEGTGLTYWASTSTASQNQVAASFVNSAEGQALYASLTNRQFVEKLYQNVLGRAGDTADVDYWTNQITSGARTRPNVLLNFSTSAELKASSVEEVRWILFSWRWKAKRPSTDHLNAFDRAKAAGYGDDAIAAAIMATTSGV
jgi:hypothetical protein